MGSEIRKPNNGCHFVKNHLKSGLKHLDFEWSSFWMVETIGIAIAKAGPFENLTIWNQTFKKSRFQKYRFQIPTVFSNAKTIREGIKKCVGICLTNVCFSSHDLCTRPKIAILVWYSNGIVLMVSWTIWIMDTKNSSILKCPVFGSPLYCIDYINNCYYTNWIIYSISFFFLVCCDCHLAHNFPGATNQIF